MDRSSSWEYENGEKLEAWHQGSGRLMVLASLISLPPTYIALGPLSPKFRIYLLQVFQVTLWSAGGKYQPF